MPTMPNFMNNWNPYAFGANVAGAAPVAYGQQQQNWNWNVPVQNLQNVPHLQQQVQVPQQQPQQIQVPEQKEQTENTFNGENLNREKRQLRAPLFRLNNPYYNRYQYPVPVWADTNQRLTNAYPTIPQNYYQAPQIVYYYYPQYPMVPQVPVQEVDQKQEDQSEQVDQDQKDQTELEQDQTELEQDQTELERQKRNADPYLPFSLNLGYPYHPATNVYHHPYPIKTRPKLNADSHLSIGLGGVHLGYPYHPAPYVYHHYYPTKAQPKTKTQPKIEADDEQDQTELERQKRNADPHISIGLGGVHVGLGSPYHGYRAPAPYYYPNYYHHHHHG